MWEKRVPQIISGCKIDGARSCVGSNFAEVELHARVLAGNRCVRVRLLFRASARLHAGGMRPACMQVCQVPREAAGSRYALEALDGIWMDAEFREDGRGAAEDRT